MIIDGAFFDLDGTLIDSFGVIYNIECEVISELGGVPPGVKELKGAMVGTSWDEFYEKFGVEDTKKAGELFYSRFRTQPLFSIPGTEKTLRKLGHLNIPLSAMSVDESVIAVTNKIKKAGLENYFERQAIYCSELGKKSDHIGEECQRRKLDPSRVIFIGDTAGDIRAAKKSGVISIAVSNDYSFHLPEVLKEADPDYTITDIRFLPTVLDRL